LTASSGNDTTLWSSRFPAGNAAAMDGVELNATAVIAAATGRIGDFRTARDASSNRSITYHHEREWAGLAARSGYTWATAAMTWPSRFLRLAASSQPGRHWRASTAPGGTSCSGPKKVAKSAGEWL
jgi:hypothetical protein